MTEYAHVKPARGSESTIEETVGAALRGLRAMEHLTLNELAARSGVSTAMISRIERGQVSASLGTLEALTGALGVPVANLFAGTVEQTEISFVPAGKGVSVRRLGSTYGHTYRLVGKVTVPHLTFEPYIIRIDGTCAGEPQFQHAGVEYMHVLEGQMRYRCGPETFDMGEGDSLCFDAGIPHGPESVQSESVTFLAVISAPDK